MSTNARRGLNPGRASSLMAGVPHPAAALMTLLTAGAAQVQDPDRLVVLLRDPAGKPVAGARGFVETRDQGGLVALAAIAPIRRADFHVAVHRRQLQTGESDASGVMRFHARDEPPNGCAGSGMVWTEAGLGALVFDLLPGSARRLDLEPMAAVTTATAAGNLVVFARATAPDGRVLTFPGPRQGTTVRLPAGNYEFWICHEDEGWLWERRVLVSGQTSVLQFPAAERRVQIAPRTIVHPLGWPHVSVERGETTHLRGAAAGALYVGLRAGRFYGPEQLPAADAHGAWPPADPTPSWLLTPVPETDASDAVFLLQRTGGADWRVVAASAERGSRSNLGDGPSQWFELPPPPPNADVWLLYVADGFAPQARPWRDSDRTFPFALERGVPLHVIAKEERGLPVVDLAVDYIPRDMDPATVAGATDARGVARLGPVLGPGVLRVSDPRFANQTIPLTAIPTEGVTIAVTAGSELGGVARWPDGTAARGVVVTLRDPTGHLRPAQRVLVSGGDGTFRFAGLPDQRPLVLFASASREHRTWSGKLAGLRGGAGDVELVLRNEDPVLGPGR